MEEYIKANKKPIPGPDERPDLYDAYDGIDRPEDWKNPVALPDHLQKMLDDRKAKLQTNKS